LNAPESGVGGLDEAASKLGDRLKQGLVDLGQRVDFAISTPTASSTDTSSALHCQQAGCGIYIQIYIYIYIYI
jgi:hypothetical protein